MHKKHEIYAPAFGGHLFYEQFLQGREGHGPLGPHPGSANGQNTIGKGEDIKLYVYVELITGSVRKCFDIEI